MHGNVLECVRGAWNRPCILNESDFRYTYSCTLYGRPGLWKFKSKNSIEYDSYLRLVPATSDVLARRNQLLMPRSVPLRLAPPRLAPPRLAPRRLAPFRLARGPPPPRRIVQGAP
jgi:hypothetical protein